MKHVEIHHRMPEEARDEETRKVLEETRAEYEKWRIRLEKIEKNGGKDLDWLCFIPDDRDLEGLSRAQAACVQEMASGKNVVVIGAAGTGKSRIIQAFNPPAFANGHPSHVVAASTGKAASQLGLQACTVHSLWHDPVLQIIRFLVIDEAYMLREDWFFGAFNKRCQEVRDCRAPFGGLALICVGGPMQLPPVDTRRERRGETPMLHTNSERFAAVMDVVFNLQTIHRQSDPRHQRILNTLRMGGRLNAEENELMEENAGVEEAELVPRVVERCRAAVEGRWEDMGPRMMVLFATLRSAMAFSDMCLNAAAAELGVGLHTFNVQLTIKVGLQTTRWHTTKHEDGSVTKTKVSRKLWFNLHDIMSKVETEEFREKMEKKAAKVDESHQWLLRSSRILNLVQSMRKALRMAGWGRKMDLTADKAPDNEVEEKTNGLVRFNDLPIPLQRVAVTAYNSTLGAVRTSRGMGVILRANICPEQGLNNGTAATVVGYVRHAPLLSKVMADARASMKKKKKEAEEGGGGGSEVDIFAEHKAARARAAANLQAMAEEPGVVVPEPPATWQHLDTASVVVRTTDGRVLVVPRCEAKADLFVPDSCTDPDGAGGAVLQREKVPMWPKNTGLRVQTTYVPCTPEAGSTIHGVQGLTCDGEVMLSLEGTFAPGQAYVGVSRARNLECVKFIGSWMPRAFFAHMGARALVKALEEFPEGAVDAVKAMEEYNVTYKRLNEDRAKRQKV